MTQRVLTTYDPIADLAERWPDWTVQMSPLTEGSEKFYPDSSLILVGTGGDLEWKISHAVAHLDLDHVEAGGPFTRQEEADASDLAALRLDLLDDWDDIPVDGEPTVSLS